LVVCCDDGIEVDEGTKAGIEALEGMIVEGIAVGTVFGLPSSGSPTNALASTIVISEVVTQSRRKHNAKA